MPSSHITFIIHDQVGGVAYMNHQIIEYANLMDHFNVRIILVKSQNDTTARFTEKFKAHEVEQFSYSQYDNFYFVLKNFNKVINKREGIIVTNDGIELQSIKLFGTKSSVYSIIHDFYNLRLAFAYYKLVDVFICHTETYARTLKSSGTDHPRIDYLPHGVRIDKNVGSNPAKINQQLKIVFIGRLVESKGVQLLYEIECKLKEKNIDVEWKIIGRGNLEQSLKKQWQDKSNVTFLAPSTNEEVMDVAKGCDLFVAPSVFEGYGIALLEAMSCGLVPLVYCLPVGITSIIPSDVGFRIEKNNIYGFVEKIEFLYKDRKLLGEMRQKAYQFVAKEYNIVETSKKYLNSFLLGKSVIIGAKSNSINKSKIPKSFGLFDKWFLPNILTMELKKIRNWIRRQQRQKLNCL
jgi:glycosyltransferase involved in cell wall biosynthesis